MSLFLITQSWCLLGKYIFDFSGISQQGNDACNRNFVGVAITFVSYIVLCISKTSAVTVLTKIYWNNVIFFNSRYFILPGNYILLCHQHHDLNGDKLTHCTLTIYNVNKSNNIRQNCAHIVWGYTVHCCNLFKIILKYRKKYDCFLLDINHI